MKCIKLIFAATAIGLAVGPANAIPFTGSGTVGGNSVAASADFTKSGQTLTIRLSNTSTADTNQETPTNTLSGLAFDIAGQSLALIPNSATANSIFQANLCDIGCATNNVGGEWGYQFNSSGITQDNLIGSAGYVN